MGGLRNFTSPKLYHSSSKSVERKVNPKQAKLVNSPASSIHEERKFCSAGPKRKIKSSALRTPSSKIGIFDKVNHLIQDCFIFIFIFFVRVGNLDSVYVSYHQWCNLKKVTNFYLDDVRLKSSAFLCYGHLRYLFF